MPTENTREEVEDRAYRWTIEPHPYDCSFTYYVTDNDDDAKDALLSLWDAAEGETSFKVEFDGTIFAGNKPDVPGRVCQRGVDGSPGCGHNNVGLSGYCIKDMPDAYGDLKGGYLCGHLCNDFSPPIEQVEVATDDPHAHDPTCSRWFHYGENDIRYIPDKPCSCRKVVSEPHYHTVECYTVDGTLDCEIDNPPTEPIPPPARGDGD